MSREEKSNTDKPVGKFTIKRTAMSDRAAAYGSYVTAAHGGTDHVPDGAVVEIEETAMEGDAKAAFSKVIASENRDLKIGGDKSSVLPEEKTDYQRGNNLCFGGDNTVVLMVAGRGDSIFLNDVNEMKSKLISQFGINQLNIHEVLPRGSQKQKLNNTLVQEVQADLHRLTDGYFIFYYSGHFLLDHTFSLVNTSGQHTGYKDEDLKKEFERLPAKKMLFILDMCYSGGAVMGARGDDESLVPCLWDMFQSKSRGDPDDRQALQWCSGSPEEQTGSTGEHGNFTHVILQVMEDLKSGTTSSVLELHKDVLKKILPFQNAMLLPERANTDSKAYFATFPKFVKC